MLARIRRRVPRVLRYIPGREAEEALLRALTCSSSEVRYRSAIALRLRSKKAPGLWGSIRSLVHRVKIPKNAVRGVSLDVQPGAFAPNRQLGNLLLEQRRFADAIVCFRSAIDARPLA